MSITSGISIAAATLITVVGGIVAGRTDSGSVPYVSSIAAVAAASPAIIRLEQWDYDRRQAKEKTNAASGAPER